MLPPIASFLSRILVVASVLIALVGLFVIAGNALVDSSSLDTVSVAQGDLTIGATPTGVIQVGGTDTWTFQATQNDVITLSMGQVSGSEPNFSPWLRLKGPDGALLGNNTGNSFAQLDVRAPLTG